MPDCVVLNSVTNLPKAMDILRSYGQVCCFLDNDEVGRKAVEEIRKQCGKISDKAIHYLPHKDLNEFLQERIRSERMTVRQGQRIKRVEKEKGNYKLCSRYHGCQYILLVQK